MKKIAMLTVVTLGAVLAISASADGENGRPAPPLFSDIDSNSDALISREEMAAAMAERLARKESRRGRGGDPEERFARVDEDGDGYLNEAEFDAVREKMEQRRGRHQRRGDCDEKVSDPES